MGKKLVSRTAKILSETKKSKDKEAVAVAYEHIPRDPNEQKHGSLYAVLELEDSGGHAEELVEGIIDALHSEFYSDPDRETLTSFESALTKINEFLAEKTREGQINWLGKLNAVLAVLAENTLHLTQAGRAEAYLFRGEHSSQITEELSGDPINPLRTFINIATGDLAENDKVVMTTPSIFFKLSKEELKKYVSETSPKKAVENLSQIISGEGGNGHAPSAVLVMEMVSPEAFVNVPEAETPGEVWIKEDKKSLEPVVEETVKGTAKAFDLLGKAASGAATFITTKAFPAVKSGAKKLASKAMRFKKHVLNKAEGEKNAERIILESEERIEEKKVGSTESLELDEETSGILESTKEDTPVTEIRIKETEKPKLLSMERFNFSFLERAKDGFSRIFKKLKLPKGKNSIIYLVFGIILIGGLIGYSVVNSQNEKAKKNAASLFAQAKTKYESALSEIENGQRAQALEDLNIAEKLANDAKNTKYGEKNAGKLISDISNARNRALGVIKNSANLFFDFGKGNLGGIVSDGTLIYTVSYEDGSVYSLDPKAKTTATITEKPGIEGKIKFATIIRSRKTLVCYTDTKNVYEIDLVSGKATKQTINGEWEDAVAMASYNSNIYLLSPIDNQIYKHLPTTTGYGRKTNYVTGAAAGELTGAIDLAIDSNAYTVDQAGQVQKYTAGAKQTYTIAGLPETLSNVKHIFTTTDTKGQYLLTPDKVIKIDENQNFVASYVSDSVKNIAGIYVDDATSMIYILSEGKVFSTSF